MKRTRNLGAAAAVAAIAITVPLATAPLATASGSFAENQDGAKHVLLVSVDGLHAFDLAKLAAHRVKPMLLDVLEHGKNGRLIQFRQLSEEDFRGGAVGVFFEKVVLHGPGLVEAELIRHLHLLEGVVVDLVLGEGVPGLADG